MMKNKRAWRHGMLALLASLSLMQGNAHALPAEQDVVVDRAGKAVRDSQGDCVYTQWPSSPDNPCRMMQAPPAMAMIPAPPPPVQEPIRRPYVQRTSVHFPHDQSYLTGHAEQELQRFAIANQGHDVRKLEIYGHADRTGTYSYNDRLSYKRAQTVARYLQQRGLQAGQHNLSAYGERRPIAQCSGLHGQRLIDCLEVDRRVDVVVTGYRVSY